MLKLTFSDTEKQALHFERFHHPHPRIQQRMEVLWLKSQGVAHGQICRLVAITENTLRSYLRLYQAGGIEALREVLFARPTSELDRYRGSLEAYFRQHPPRSVNEAAAIVEQQTGIRRSHEQVRKFLLRLGLRCRKVGMVPAKADPVAQAMFKKKSSSHVWSKPKQAARAVFFVDATHFVLAPFLGFLWSFVRVFVRAPAGRQRFHVLGAIEAVSLTLVTVTNATTINAQSVCELLHKLRAAVPLVVGKFSTTMRAKVSVITTL